MISSRGLSIRLSHLIEDQDAEAYYNSDLKHLILQQYDKVLADFNQGFTLNFHYAKVYNNCGFTYDV